MKESTKYLIFGNGWIGNKFKNYLSNDAVLSDRRINSIKDIYIELAKYNPEIIINCIGKTGRPNIDSCESNKESTFFSNVTIPMYLAEVCKDTGKYLVHLSSGCIYEGDKDGKGYGEYDTPNFKGSFYSRTKIFAEDILQEYRSDIRLLCIRIRMPIDNKPSDRNLIDKLIRYKQVVNVPNSITYIPDLMNITKQLMDRKVSGWINIVNKGGITHKYILEMYKEIVDPNFELPEFINSDELDKMTLAKRSNCVLTSERLPELDINIRNSKDAVRYAMERYKKWV